MKAIEIDWKSWKDALVDLIFPGECPICEEGAYLEGSSFGCLSCLDSLSWLNASRCKICGESMPLPIAIELECPSCRECRPSFSAGRSMFQLDEKGRALVHAIKYGGEKRLVGDACHWIKRSDGFKDFIYNAVLVPVPLHKKKMRKRGFNQSVWIAEEFAKVAGGRTIVYDCLERKRPTQTQTKLNRSERKNNVKNAFALRSGTCLDGFSEIVLIDDVYTTGSTLDACTKVLLGSGCSKVKVATMGRG